MRLVFVADYRIAIRMHHLSSEIISGLTDESEQSFRLLTLTRDAELSARQVSARIVGADKLCKAYYHGPNLLPVILAYHMALGAALMRNTNR